MKFVLLIILGAIIAFYAGAMVNFFPFIGDDLTINVLAPGENRHFEPGENNQFQPGRNRQSVPGGCSQPRFECRF